MIDMGTTAAVDTSQVNHTPEHSDAGIRALQESGLRAVYAYSRGAGPARAISAGPACGCGRPISAPRISF